MSKGNVILRAEGLLNSAPETFLSTTSALEVLLLLPLSIPWPRLERHYMKSKSYKVFDENFITFESHLCPMSKGMGKFKNLKELINEINRLRGDNDCLVMLKEDRDTGMQHLELFID